MLLGTRPGRMVLAMALMLCATCAQAVTASPATAAGSPTAIVRAPVTQPTLKSGLVANYHPAPVPDEHVRPVSGHVTTTRLAAQLPKDSTIGARPRAATAPQLDLSNAFLTRPYMNWHAVNSVFDHCNPDYSTDGKICEFDGSVALRSNGSDPGFSLGYAQTPGGGDYLYYDGHNGWDLALNYENVMAAADGIVHIAGSDVNNPCFGQTIVIDHPNGFSTRYAHMSAIYVSVGQNVTRGQIIGQSGNTGCSTGPHLHFGVYITSSWTAIDPWGWQGAPGADPWPSDQGDLWLTGNPQNPIPSEPQNVAATPLNGAALVTWAAPAFTASMPIANYTVTVSPGGTSINVPGTQTTASFSGLNNGTLYSFTVTATNSIGTGPASPASSTVMPTTGGSIAYFAEGYTGAGFTEALSLLMPSQSGTAVIDYFMPGNHTTATVALTAGQVANVDVNAAVGANQQVAIRVLFTGAGIVERSFHYQAGSWLGTTDKIGVSKSSTEWDFAEGSTYSQFSEYLTLLNPNGFDTPVDLNYFTDGGAHPTKSLTIPAQSRVTVEVFSGDLNSNGACVPNNGGANCGVGRGIGGVSTRVVSHGGGIIAERTQYVNGYNFGSGTVTGGDAVFGATAPASAWDFAEGTTLPGFNEFLSVENPNATTATVTVTYMVSGQPIVKKFGMTAQSRATVPVYDATAGVGLGVTGVSARVQADHPIVVERPMYIVHDFGSGPVAGADDAIGATSLSRTFQFVRGSTASGEYQYLTIENPGGATASVSLTYYTSNGIVARTIAVGPSTRTTVGLFMTPLGVGTGVGAVRIAIASDQPILVEKPAYSTNSSDYGATVTIGFSSAS